MKIVVLGAGRVGSAIVADLAADRDFVVTVADTSDEALRRATSLGAAHVIQADLADAATVGSLAADHDLVVGAVPGPIGFQTLKAVVQAGTHYVDIAFFEEDPFEADEVAKQNGVTALVDCGVAPGLSNLILGYHSANADSVERFICYVGGLPVNRDNVFQYKAPFSPIDVVAEYTRPARYIEGGQLKEAPALSQIERLDFADVGTLEAFLTDGLRSLVHTLDVPDMQEKTMRYPGHAQQMLLLREMGLFNAEPVNVGGVPVSPLQLTTQLLFPMWQFNPREPDLTVMRVEVDATESKASTRHIYDLLDYYDATTDTASMARTTGYTCTAMVRLVARGAYTKPGVSPPEYVGRETGCFEAVRKDLEARGIKLVESVEPM